MTNDVLYIATNGGGGYMDPLDRDPEAVFTDVRERIVSPEAAREFYGVVMREGVLDIGATKGLRATLVARRQRSKGTFRVETDDVPKSTGMSPKLNVQSDVVSQKVCCTDCGYSLGLRGRSWKGSADVEEIPTDRLTHEVITGESAETIMRQFFCPACGALLDTETALAGEPYLDDIVTT
jgi:N-methylhydantoinase B